MIDEQVLQQLQQLNIELFGEKGEGTNVLRSFDPPFDISKPNIHDSKKEFMRELKAVERVLKHTRGIVEQFSNAKSKGGDKQREMVARLANSVSGHAWNERRRTRIESTSDLILSNLANDDFFYNSLFVVFDMIKAYEKRFAELKEQEVEFWSVSHRAPNYYARTIALRFAKHFARHKQTKPTFGTASEGKHPSTEFGRGLEAVFSILEIKADVRKAAEWAIAQLTEADVNPPQNALAGGLFNVLSSNQQSKPTADTIETIANMLRKGQ
jgi:hypothetical protein